MYGMYGYGYGYGYGLDPTIDRCGSFFVGSGTCKFHVLQIFKSPQHDRNDRS